jgi:hypothetical protein
MIRRYFTVILPGSVSAAATGAGQREEGSSGSCSFLHRLCP